MSASGWSQVKHSGTLAQHALTADRVKGVNAYLALNLQSGRLPSEWQKQVGVLFGSGGSAGQFDVLIEDLRLFHAELGVATRDLIERVEQEKTEALEGQDAYEDHMQDVWKERWREERATERSVSDMFESLRGDRD